MTRRSSAGFGLIEVLAALAITGLIGASLGAVLNQAVSADAKIENFHADLRAIDAAQRAFATLLASMHDSARPTGSTMIDGRAMGVAFFGQGPKLLDARAPRQFQITVERRREKALELQLKSPSARDAASRSASLGEFNSVELSYLVSQADSTTNWMSEWRGPARRLTAIKLTLAGAKTALTVTRIHLIRSQAAPACFANDEPACKGLD